MCRVGIDSIKFIDTSLCKLTNDRELEESTQSRIRFAFEANFSLF